MSVSYVEREQADQLTNSFYDDAEERFELQLNIFKVFGHTPKLGAIFTESVMEMLQDSYLDWKTKELLILKATHRNDCQYCVVQHEAVSQRLGITAEKIADIEGDKYKTSPHYTDGEKALLDLNGADRRRREPHQQRHLGSSQGTLRRVTDRRGGLRHHAIHRDQQFGDALGVVLEPVFLGGEPILNVEH
jgi:4-carboxymuconolactone decarboxylase